MKVKDQITQEISALKIELDKVDKEHDKLDQISMLSAEGSKLRRRYHEIQGMIRGLEWVINDRLMGYLHHE